MDTVRTVRLVLEVLDQASPELKAVTGLIGTLNTAIKGFAGYELLKESWEKISEVARFAGEQVGEAINMAVEFNEAMATVSARAGANAEQLNSLKNAAYQLSQTTQWALNQVTAAEVALAGADLKTADTIRLLPKVLDFAEVGFVSTADAARYTAQAMKAFQLDAEHASAVVDAMAAVMNKTGQPLSEVAEAFRMAGPAAKVVGADFNDLSAALLELSQNGLKGSEAGMVLRTMLYTLVGKLDEGATGLKQYNLSIRDTQGNFVGLTEVMRRFAQAGIEPAQAIQLFGRRVGPQLAIMLAQGADAFEKYKRQIGDTNGYVERLAQIQDANLGDSLKRLQHSLENTKTALGDALTPAIRAIVDNALLPFAQEAATAAEKNDLLKATIADIAAEAVGAVEGLARLASAFADGADKAAGFAGVGVKTADVMAGLIHAIPGVTQIETFVNAMGLLSKLKPTGDTDKFAMMFAVLRKQMDEGKISGEEYKGALENFGKLAKESGVDVDSLSFRLATTRAALHLVAQDARDAADGMKNAGQAGKDAGDQIGGSKKPIDEASQRLSDFNEKLAVLGIETLAQLKTKMDTLRSAREILPKLGLSPAQVASLTYAFDQLEVKLAQSGAESTKFGGALDWALRRAGTEALKDLQLSLGYAREAFRQATKEFEGGKISTESYERIVRSLDQVDKKARDAGITVRTFGQEFDDAAVKAGRAGRSAAEIGADLAAALDRLGIPAVSDLKAKLDDLSNAAGLAKEAFDKGLISEEQYRAEIESIDKIVKTLRDAGSSAQFFGKSLSDALAHAGQQTPQAFTQQIDAMNVAVAQMIDELGRVAGTDVEKQFLAMAEALLSAADAVDGTNGLVQGIEKLRSLVQGSKDLFSQITGRNFVGVQQDVDKLAAAYRKLIEEQSNISPDAFRKLREQIRAGAQDLYDRYGWVQGMQDLNDLLQEAPIPIMEMGDALNFVAEHGFVALHEQLISVGMQIRSLGETIRINLAQIGISAVGQFANALVEAASGGADAFREFFKQLIKQLIAAIIQAVILRAIMAAIGLSGGGVATSGGTTGAGPYSGPSIATSLDVGIQHAQHGLIVSGADFGRDVVPAMLRPGEAVLPPELTTLLLRAAESTYGAGGAGGQIVIHLQSDVPAFVKKVNTSVSRGRVQVLASKVVS